MSPLSGQITVHQTENMFLSFSLFFATYVLNIIHLFLTYLSFFVEYQISPVTRCTILTRLAITVISHRRCLELMSRSRNTSHHTSSMLGATHDFPPFMYLSTSNCL